MAKGEKDKMRGNVSLTKGIAGSVKVCDSAHTTYV